MSQHDSSRREFLRNSAAATAAFAFAARAIGQGDDAAKAKAPLEHRKFGKTDMNVAVLGFGGAEIGFEATDGATVNKLLNAALDAGLNVVDTAECYGDSEVAIAKAIGKRRKEFYVFTKCGHIQDDGKRGPVWDKGGIQRSIERSLKRLQTDVIDLLQLHTCSLDELKKGECIEALEQAKKDGKIRYMGYSGDHDAARYAVECGRFDALQTSVSICDQEAIDLTLPLAKEKNMGVVVKRPIANAAWRYDATPENKNHVEYWKRLQELKYDFATGDARKKEGPDGPAGVAMRFVAMQPGVDVLIVGTTKPDRWAQNADLMRAGPLKQDLADSIRATWKRVAKKEWIGQS